jgi:regulatory protein YycI of two-component signal transduction system YycFG
LYELVFILWYIIFTIKYVQIKAAAQLEYTKAHKEVKRSVKRDKNDNIIILHTRLNKRIIKGIQRNSYTTWRDKRRRDTIR